MYKTIAEVETALQDRTYADSVLSRVDKGNRGKFTYIPWNESARLLNQIFGVMGWSTEKISSVDDLARGIFIYDLALSVSVIGDHGEMARKTVTGRGFGAVSAKAMERGDVDAMDTASKGARSDALSVACKLLGEAFGIFLYDKGDPAHSESYVAQHADTTTAMESRNEEQHTTTASVQKSAPVAGKVGNASEKQANVLRKHGWSDAQIQGMDYASVKDVMDSIMNPSRDEIRPPKVASGANLTLVKPTGTDNIDF